MFSPYGASITVSATATSQTIAIPTLPGGENNALLIYKASGTSTRLIIKLGDSAISVTPNDGMSFVANPDSMLVGIEGSPTHFAIRTDGGTADVHITPGRYVG